jgi:hypothetical protein
MGSLNYGFLLFLNSHQLNIDFSNVGKGSQNNMDRLIYFIFANEFMFLLIKLLIKFWKLIIDLTSINLQKTWDYRRPVFNFLSFARYTFKIIIEIKFCIILFRLGLIPILFIIDVFFSVINLVKQAIKLYDNYRITVYIGR